MWFFNSPEVVFGEGALCYLAQLHGTRAYLITDPQMVQFGYVDRVKEQLAQANLETRVFAEVEPEPSLETVRRGAALLREFEPDWIVGLGGGSAIDAAKAMWALYERPDLPPDGISPLEYLGLGKKARLIAISTTSGTGAEATWAAVLTDTAEHRKVIAASREMLPSTAIVDPVFASNMPPRLTADTGLDALTHAIEGYAATWHSDFSDGLCLKAAELVFKFLPQAYRNGSDAEAREKMHNAAALAGLGFINSACSLAHAMGHSFGSLFHIPHGRSVSLFLPYTMEFSANGGVHRYADIAHFIHIEFRDPAEGTRKLIQAVRDLEKRLESNTNVASLGLPRGEYGNAMEVMLDHTENDTQILASPRPPDREELRQLFEYAYEGRTVDF